MLLFSPALVSAQNVFAPLSPPSFESSSKAFFSTNGQTAESILGAAAPDPLAGTPLRWGPFAAHPHLDYQFIYASGIRQADETLDTLQHLFNVAVGVQLGPHWKLDTAGNYSVYSASQMDSTFGYSIGLHGGVAYDAWTFGVNIGLSSSETTQMETAQQTQQSTYVVGLTAVYAAGRRLSYEFGLNQNITLSKDFNNTYEWSTMEWVNYLVTRKVTVGLGLGAGYNILDTGAASVTDSFYEQIQGRVSWNPGPKLSVSLSGGAQIQQYDTEPSSGSVVNPIYALSAGWSPFSGTSLSLMASQTVGDAIASDQSTVATIASLNLNQRLFGKVMLGVSPSLTLTDYRSNSSPDSSAARADEAFAIRVSLGTTFLRRIGTSIFFNYQDNQSDDEFYDFDSRQYGFQISYGF